MSNIYTFYIEMNVYMLLHINCYEYIDVIAKSYRRQLKNVYSAELG